ncbi:MAG: hypothetical protein JNL33_05690 [Betaproteobacteria bacterium]|nr:hypothetical protein [Betaproteobacteria bacterium]
MRSQRIRGYVVLVVLLSLSGRVTEALGVDSLPRYRLTQVAGFASLVSDLNESGDVVGMQSRRAFVWKNGAMQFLPPIGNALSAESTAYSISDSGAIVGTAGGRAVIWRNGIPSDLGQVEWWQGLNIAYDINSIGQVSVMLSGRYDIFSTDMRAYRWEDGAFTDLGVFGRDYRGSPYTDAVAINESGWIAGNGHNTSYLWRDGVFAALSPLGGVSAYTTARVHDLNNGGAVAGESTDASGATRATIWRDGSAFGLPGTVTGFIPRSAWALNDFGWAVGNGSKNEILPNGYYYTSAFVFSESFGTRDLADLIDPSDPLYGNVRLTSARGINNRGQVIAESADGYTNASYLLTPISTCEEAECVWRQGRSGSFIDYVNWDPSAAPVETSRLRIVLDSSQTVSVPKVGSKVQELSVGTSGSGSTTLTLSMQGGATLETTSSFRHLGGDVKIGGTGVVKVGGALSVGDGEGTGGKLTFMDGVAAEVAGRVLVGRRSKGDLLITGANARLTALMEVVVGGESEGVVRVQSGGILSAPEITLGSQSGGHGILGVEGGGVRVGGLASSTQSGASRVDALDRMSIGVSGKGRLEVSDGFVRVGDSQDGVLDVGSQGEVKQSGASAGLVVGGASARGVVNLHAGGTWDFGTQPAGLAIEVRRGEVNARGEMKLQLATARGDEIGPLAQDSVLRLGGRVEVSAVPSSIAPGDARVAMVARRIELGGSSPLRVVGSSGEEVLLGGTTFKVPKIADGAAPGGSTFFMPETLRVPGGGNTGVAEYMALNFRAVQQGIASGAGPVVPTFGSIESTNHFIKSSAVLSAAYLASAIYDGSSIGSTLTAKGEGYKVLSAFDMEGLRAAAVQSISQPGEISIVIRGSSTGENWIANGSWIETVTSGRGSFEPNDTLVRYVHNLSSFSAGVFGANPDASIRFVGHSLGGALSLLLARSMGVDAYAFNAPPLAEAYGLFLEETSSIRSVKNVSGTDGLLNVRLIGDVVSSPVTRIPGIQPVGQTVTIDPVANAYRAMGADDSPLVRASRAQLLGATRDYYNSFRNSHSIASVLKELEEQQLKSVDTVSRDGQVVLTSDPNDYIAIPGEGPAQILLPTRVEGAVKEIEAVVSGGRVIPADPGLAHGYQFESSASSPAFAAVLFPLLDPRDQDYWVEILDEGDWVKIAEVKANSHLEFRPGGVHAFRVRGITDISDPVQIDNVFFGLVFENDGELSMRVAELSLDGNPVAVPEPATNRLLALGGALLLLANRRRNINKIT